MVQGGDINSVEMWDVSDWIIISVSVHNILYCIVEYYVSYVEVGKRIRLKPC